MLVSVYGVHVCMYVYVRSHVRAPFKYVCVDVRLCLCMHTYIWVYFQSHMCIFEGMKCIVESYPPIYRVLLPIISSNLWLINHLHAQTAHSHTHTLKVALQAWFNFPFNLISSHYSNVLSYFLLLLLFSVFLCNLSRKEWPSMGSEARNKSVWY